MKSSVLLLLAGFAAASACAQAADPLKSEACAAALASLQSARSAGQGSVEGARAVAATACLGSAGQPSRPSRTLQAPIVVPAPQVELPEPAASLRIAPPRLPEAPVAIERAPMPAQCDSAGCWAPGGTHLRHVPPNLAGPGASCVQQGAAVYCP